MGAHLFTGSDGVELAWHETGAGRTLILLPGFGGAGARMLDTELVRTLAERGHRVVVPDFRGCGDSGGADDPRGYPADALATDGLALVDHLGLGDQEYDLGGYSLGARIAVRMLARGAAPGRAIVAGQGLAKVSGPQGGGANRRVLTALVDGVAFEPDSADERAARAILHGGANPRALLHVLESLMPTPEDDLRRITVPVLVAIGDRDERADADRLAELLPNARFVRVPGDHGSAFFAPELTTAITEFVTAR
ncbi:alpha/beta fold hydrolase [Nocardia macrotermitis]|uniref:2-succinyl-6-hydroxy-2, 4-cyclohexadiene-1-carboxylate synthase n=1 Tax=Nocardia macrotermitis TaxID=2585198 RepID=A0A7K0D8D0_9NOCA|nr:alpha/beta fold hydrolase [Nocardia macrotermitis]MQY22016.1 2-succinyl-6-hydroxy-2,4-cyclohexadiene-1-carboxylate synthase [Nocardia macrotermitis]